MFLKLQILSLKVYWAWIQWSGFRIQRV